MTTCEKNVALLKAFGIPAGSGDSADTVRAVLARQLAARSLRLADLQTVRDILECAAENEPKPFEFAAEVWLFVAAMFISENRGNAYMSEGDAVSFLASGGHLEDPEGHGFDEDNKHFDETVAKLGATLNIDAWRCKLVGDILVNPEGTDQWFFQRNKAAVDDLNKTFSEFLTVKRLSDASADILAKAAAFKGFCLNEAQKKALAAAASQRFTVITGGPGTGKTTTVCAILRALLEMSPEWTEKDIALAAPTGRAAQRMQEAILDQCEGLGKEEHIVTLADKLVGSTIHRLLGGYAPNWKHDEKYPLEQKVVIVDETSMVDLYLMQALLKALAPGARLILLGDADQLPSVDTGAVLGDLTRLGLDNGAESSVVRRLEICERAKGEISAVAKQINEAKDDDSSSQAMIDVWADKKLEHANLNLEALTVADGSVFRWLENKEDIKKADILALYEKLMKGSRLVDLAKEMPKDDPSLSGTMSPKAKGLFAELNRRRILTLVREGKYGVNEANAHLLKVAKAATDRKYADYLSLVGVPIMVTKNAAVKNSRLFNGDVGVTVKGATGMVVLFPRGRKTVVCPVALLPEHELAYAMTVHKSQGSEFENVLVVLPGDANHPLLNRQIVYTGLTRAKRRAVIIGTEPSLRAALARKLERNTGIVISPT